MARSRSTECFDQFNEVFNEVTNQFEKEIRQKLFQQSPWFTLIRREEWPDYAGEEINTTIFEPKMPTNENEDWPDKYPAQDNVDTPCVPETEVVQSGITNRSMKLQSLAIESDPICLEKLRTGFAISETLEKTKAMLARYIRAKWANFYRLGFYNLTSTHWVLTPSDILETSQDFETYNNAPTAGLNIETLQNGYDRLTEDASDEFAYGQADGAPVFACLIGNRAKNRLLMGNPDIRQDVRWAKPYENLQYMGIRSYSNFAFIGEKYPMRFDTDENGDLVYISTFDNTSATKGTKSRVNPDWRNARFEVAWLFTSGVFDVLVPKPLSTLGAGTSFKPINYIGDLRWVNEYDKDCNPDMNIGFWRANLQAARRPWFSEMGIAILFDRCINDDEREGCEYEEDPVYELA